MHIWVTRPQWKLDCHPDIGDAEIKDNHDWCRSCTSAYIPWGSKDYPLMWKMNNWK